MKYPIERQIELVQAQFPGAIHRVRGLLDRHDRRIMQLALQRGRGTGVEEYGDDSFHKPLGELKRETLEELADAVWYQAIYSGKESGYII